MAPFTSPSDCQGCVFFSKKKTTEPERRVSTLRKTQEAGRHLDWILFGPEQVSADCEQWEAAAWNPACVSTSLALSSSLSAAPAAATLPHLLLLRPWTLRSLFTSSVHFFMPYFFFFFASSTVAIGCNKGTTCANDVNDGASSSLSGSGQKIDVTWGFLTKNGSDCFEKKQSTGLLTRPFGRNDCTYMATFYLRNQSKCGNNPAEFWKVVKSLRGITSSSFPQHVTVGLNKSNGFKHSLYLERSSVWPN